jgi:Zn finger protein HypA/HybF involved in hydrogenase expression
MNKDQLELYFSTNKTISTVRIKKLLFKYNIKSYKCEECNINQTYNNKPIVLQLHHIDGNNSNNSIKNFQILCPNCHSQTQTFRSKKSLTEEDIIKACKKAKTISEVITNLNRYPSGNLYNKIEKIIQKHNLNIKKYNYKINNKALKKHLTCKIDKCKCCKATYKKKNSSQLFCSLICAKKANCKFHVDEIKAIQLIQEVGWLKAAIMLGINTKNPDSNLRLIIKRYIKNNNLDINIYSLSKHSKHSRSLLKNI